MGNEFSVDGSELNLEAALETASRACDDVPVVGAAGAKRNNVKIWEVNESETKAFHVQSNVRFSAQASYIAIHTYTVNKPGLRTGIEDNVNFADSTIPLTPRGLRTAFSQHEHCVVPNQTGAAFGFCIYVWNGKIADKATRARCVCLALQAERVLSRGNASTSSFFHNGVHLPFNSPLRVRECHLDRDAPHLSVHIAFIMSLGLPQPTKAWQPPTFTRCMSLASLLGLTPSSSEARSASPTPSNASQSSWGSPKTLMETNSKGAPSESGSPAPLRVSNEIHTSSSAVSLTAPRPGDISAGSSSLSLKSNSSLKLARPNNLSIPRLTKLCVSPESPDGQRSQRLEVVLKEMSVVYPYLSVGGYIPACELARIKESKVTHILNSAAMVCENHFPQDVTYISWNVLDSPDEDIMALFPLVVANIENVRKSGGHMYVHCHQGVSRSCTLVLAYMIWLENLTFDAANERLKAVRSTCSPNAGFIHALIRWNTFLNAPPMNHHLFRLTLFSAKYESPVLLKLYRPEMDSEPTSPCDCTYLDPRTSYYLHSKETCYMWIGSCNKHLIEELTASVNILHNVIYKNQSQVVTIHQGEETEDFWRTVRVFNSTVLVKEISRYDGYFKTAPEVKGPETKGPEGVVGELTPLTASPLSKPNVELYAWPKLEKLELFDLDDLDEQAIFVVFHVTENVFVPEVAMYIWFGEDCGRKSLTAEEEEGIKKFYYDLKKFDDEPCSTIYEISGDESDVFMKMFT